VKQRLASLDAFRGFTILSMILVNNPGDWNNTYAALLHAKWHGWTFTDWIFPFFLFISGMSMVMSVGQPLPVNRPAVLLNLFKRALIIFVIGLILNFVPAFDLTTLRVPGVLQRIALCVFLAAPLVVYGRWQTQLAALLVCLAVYSFLMLKVAVPDALGVVSLGSLEPGRDTGAYIDRWLLDGHLWAGGKTWDPEGLLSTLPALASLLFGCLTSHWLRASNKTSNFTLLGLMLGGVLCLLAGQFLSQVLMPINKSLWTPSYAVFMNGIALILFGCFYWAIDLTKLLRFQPLIVMGMNALFLFVMSSLIAKALNTIKWANESGQLLSAKLHLFAPIKSLGLSAQNSSLLFALMFCLVLYAIGFLMFQKRWFVKV
jgi:predicted acyltransferase